MSLNLSKFMSRVNRYDMARSNLYTVVFPSITGLTNKYNDVSEYKGIQTNDLISTIISLLGGDTSIENNIAMMAKSISLPGSTLDTEVEKSRRKNRNVIKGKTNDTVTITFYLTSTHPERKFMLSWLDSIYNDSTNTVAFESDYAKTIEIITHDRRGYNATITKLVNAYPIRVGSVDLTYEDNNVISVFETEFVLERYGYS